LDFLTDEQGSEHFYNVAFDLQPVQDNVVWENVIIKESMWAYPREQSAKEKMRLCYEEQTGEPTAFLRSADLADRLHERFSAEKMYEKFVDLFDSDSTVEMNQWLQELEEEIEEHE